MNKILTCVFTAITASFFLFAGCDTPKIEDKGIEVKTQTDCVYFTVTDAFEGLNDKATMYDGLIALKSQDKLVFDGNNSEYGFYITSVNGKTAEGNSYWAVYTTLVELDGVTYSSAEYGTKTIDGITMQSASFGVSSLPLVVGETYGLFYETYTVA